MEMCLPMANAPVQQLVDDALRHQLHRAQLLFAQLSGQLANHLCDRMHPPSAQAPEHDPDTLH